MRPGKIILWDLVLGKSRQEFENLKEDIRAVAFSPDGNLLASASGGPAPDWLEGGSVDLWSVVTGERISRLAKHEMGYYSVAFSPDGSLLAAGDGKGEIHLWNVTTRLKVGDLKGHSAAVEDLDFTRIGNRLVSAGRDGMAFVWALPPIDTDEAVTGDHLDTREFMALWFNLGTPDAFLAHEAIARLVQSSKTALVFLERKLGEPIWIESSELPRLIADLDSDEFKIRFRALKELEKVGDHARAALVGALDPGQA